jgi:hypothetical protein
MIYEFILTEKCHKVKKKEIGFTSFRSLMFVTFLVEFPILVFKVNVIWISLTSYKRNGLALFLCVYVEIDGIWCCDAGTMTPSCKNQAQYYNGQK